MRALVVGHGLHEPGEAIRLPRGLGLGARVQGADEQPLRLGGLLPQRDRLGDGGEELLRGAGRVGQTHLIASIGLRLRPAV